MSTSLEQYGPPTSDAERQRIGDLLAEAFGFPAQEAPAWLAIAGVENIRVTRDADGAIQSGLILVPMGQFWGGRSVPTAGFAGVGVSPMARGSGAGTRMMAAALRELRSRDFPLAVLFSSTFPIYRKVGFEQAGVRAAIKAPVSALPRGDRSLPVRAAREEDRGVIEQLYVAQARRRAGWLERGSYLWSRVRKPRGLGPAAGYLFGPTDAPEGYVLLARVRHPTGHQHDLLVTDMAATTPRALQRIATFLADHAPIAEHITWAGGVDDALYGLLPDRAQFEMEANEHWMLRMVNVPAALMARGWSVGLSAELHLDVADDVLPENAGRWVLEVSGGEARVRAGGEGRLRLSARALACLYSGHRGAHELARSGLIEASDEVLDVADAVFAGRPPSMMDLF